jgi:hypothetical protein
MVCAMCNIILIIIDYIIILCTYCDDNNNSVPPVWEILHVTSLDGTRNYRRRVDDHLSLDPREQGARPLFSLFPSAAPDVYNIIYPRTEHVIYYIRV